MRWAVRIKQLSLPPAGPLLLGFMGLVLAATSWEISGLALVAICLGSLYLLSAPWFVGPWLQRVDRYPHFDPANPVESPGPPPEAIVILDSGRMNAPAERGGEMVTARTLERIDQGARLHRALDIPILVTGYGYLMQRVLVDSFGIEARWVESRSSNTHENAVFSAEMLRRDGVDHVYLVTHFWHLKRSLKAFHHAGIKAIPIPAGRTAQAPSEVGLMALVPSMRMLEASYFLLHEWIGIVWYRIRYHHR